jgi:hypothetical protein
MAGCHRNDSDASHSVRGLALCCWSSSRLAG